MRICKALKGTCMEFDSLEISSVQQLARKDTEKIQQEAGKRSLDLADVPRDF